MYLTPILIKSEEWLRKELAKVLTPRNPKSLVQWWIDNDLLPTKPFGTREWYKDNPYKDCPTCKESLHITRYGIRPNRSKRQNKLNISSLCTKCNSNQDRRIAGLPDFDGKPLDIKYSGNAGDRGRKIKKILMEYMGGCCHRCGYKGQPPQMDFDHIDPTIKSIPLGTSGIGHKTIDELIEEVKKVQMLCSNCHRLVSTKHKHHYSISTHLDDGINGVLAAMSSPEPDKEKLRKDGPQKESIYDGTGHIPLSGAGYYKRRETNL
tara:strand:- start:40 stop:831 length:792 start_codon:yes stop_codon:yes gene_type:complete